MRKAIPQERSQIGIKRSVKPTLSDTSVKEITPAVMVLIMRANTILCFNAFVFLLSNKYRHFHFMSERINSFAKDNVHKVVVTMATDNE